MTKSKKSDNDETSFGCTYSLSVDEQNTRGPGILYLAIRFRAEKHEEGRSLFFFTTILSLSAVSLFTGYAFWEIRAASPGGGASRTVSRHPANCLTNPTGEMGEGVGRKTGQGHGGKTFLTSSQPSRVPRRSPIQVLTGPNVA